MRILLIEDDDDLAEALGSALEGLEFEVTRAADGEEGLYLATEWPWDAVVLDWRLPRLEGIEVLRRLRATSSVPVLLLTARDALNDRVRGLEEGADDYVVKPVALPELAARLRALYRRSLGALNGRLALGDLSIDFLTCTVERGGERIPLTRAEWILFSTLCARPGEPVSSRELADRLADGEEPAHLNTVAVHIRNLRRKLGEKKILTRRGFGYLIRREGAAEP